MSDLTATAAFGEGVEHSVAGDGGAGVDTGTIGWLLPEIVQAFDHATTALRTFRAGAAGVDRADVDLASLRVARSHLHQAHGALELGEIAGVTRVTEAIEEFLAVFEAEPERCDATALDAIIGGCRAIVEYLEDLQGGARQQPLHLFPSYRDLLTARGVDRIHPADLFLVDLGVRPPREAGGTALDRKGLIEQRAVFERGLLRYIRDENDMKALANLARAVTAIDGSIAATATPAQSQQRAFWWATRALFDALANNGFATAAPQHGHLKRLAGRINLQIRKLVDGSNAVAERLFADALFFVAIAAPVTQHVRDVQARYRLAGAVPADFDKQRYGRVDPAGLRAAREALSASKSAWAAVVAGDVKQIPDFAKHTTSLLDAVGALRRRGLSQVAQVIDGIATDLGFDPRQPPSAVGLDVATALLFVEGALERTRLLDDAFDERAALVVARLEASALGQPHPSTPIDWLDRMSREAEERLTVAAFVAELQANLRSAEKELDAFFRDAAARAGLPEAQKALAQVSGALALLGHDDAHRAVDHARGTIARFVEQDGAVDQTVFETLAQSLGAVGFYVDQIKHDRIDPTAFTFDAETGRFSAVIGRPATAAAPTDVPDDMIATVIDAAHDGFPAVEAPETSTNLTYSEIAFAATQVLDSEKTLEEEIAHRAADARDHAMRLRADPADRTLRDQLAAAVDDVRRNAALIDDRSLQDEAATVLGSLRRAAQQPLGAAAVAEIADAVVALTARADRSVGIAPPSVAPAEPVVAVPSADNLEAVDAELLGIFLEEGGAVLQDATDAMRVLDADPQNATATINLRRGFHTLKGSSRMVGLMAFGEAAWAIEDTLNGHIADQVPASSDLRALIDYAIRYLSGWIAELHQHGGSSRVPDALVEAARAVRAGGSPTAMDSVPTAVADPEPTFAATEILESEPTFAATEIVEPEPMFVETEISESDLTFATTEIIEPAPPPEDDEPLLEEDTLFAPTHGEVADRAYAATEVIGPDQEAELRFFGEQPQHPTADAAASSTSEEADEALPTIEAVDAPSIEIASPGDETVPSLDWLDIPEVAANDASVDEPVATETSAGEAVDETEAPDVAAAAPERSDNVVAFVPRDMTPAGDELRRIGSLTLSVALFNIYLTEADELLRVLTQDFAEWKHELDRVVSDSAVRAVHSLSGSSATVGLAPAHDIASAIEEVLVSLYRDPVPLTAQHVDVMQDAVESLRRMLHRFAAERMPEPDPVRIAALIALQREFGAPIVAATPVEFAPAPVETVPMPVETASTELSFDALDFGDEAIASVPQTPKDEEPVAFEGSVDLAPLESDTPEISTEALRDGEDIDAIAAIGATHTPDAPSPVDDESAEFEFEFEPLSPSEDAPVLEAPVPVDDVSAEAPVDEPVAEFEEAPVDLVDVMPAIAELDMAPQSRRVVPSERETAVTDDLDPDLLDVFVEEGNEVLPQIGELLRTWQAHRDNAASSRLLLRHLHTLKGSARMAGAMRLGEVVHDMEARVESAARLSEVPLPLMDELVAAHDRSLELFDELQRPPVEAVAEVPAQAPAEAVAGAPEVAPVAEALTPVAAAPRARDPKQSPQHVVRVGSETLDRLVNLAGEVSISRARIENEVVQLKGAMADLSDNVERLRAQLREIELQAEFQMQSQMQSQQAAGAEREKFDPLEFDRFTRFQELTRMMAESVNDVKTVQQHLQKSLDSAEVDLTSQRRMTRDLQQDLMSVRMVPFSSIAERLYRVARRSAKEVDKRVNLDIRGGSVEIDRSVLERMAGPFEHLLRNHIVHGIETRETRRAEGKEETGELLVEVRQEGNEIVLTFSDDGAGLDHDRIRAKGRELGLIGDTDIGDADAAELIFHPGFSTVSEVTELAGRGVGMDVVRSEAMELAGRVTVDSERGRGTRFTITLPLTLAVTQVVLVSVANRVYAMPAVLVEQVHQLRPQPLAEAYRAGELDRPGGAVRLAFLGALLGLDDAAPVAQRTSPVLILRSAGDRIAVHVDEVVGNQEVVVKNLGPQLARMTGIAGATVLGSGEIVLILNPVQLSQVIRAEAARVESQSAQSAQSTDAGSTQPAEAQATLQTLPTVMVVDDSLTVRRVTQRLLSREGYQVVLAKDGVDALEQLQDYVPDAMLVDIEMPRMDGFDLTRNVRNDERYRRIPIIMITSRTAEKHRRHAAELGVDAYLGKPYQEDELLELLTLHVEAKRSQPA